MKRFNEGDVWFVEFPLDVPILYWQDANLKLASTARVSKVMILSADNFIFKIGTLHPDDLKRIEDAYIQFMKNFPF